MRQLIRTYSITGLHEITITDYTFTKQDIRLIINESLASAAITTEDLVASVLVSSTKKANVVSVVNGVITLANTTANLTVGDELTIEIDIDNIAKEANATANKNAIINAINNIDLSTVAKETTAQQILTGVGETAKLGDNPDATNTEILKAIENIEFPEDITVDQQEVVYVENYAALLLIEHPSESVLYITEDTGYMYKYRNGEFLLIEDGEQVDNTLYFSSSFTSMSNLLKNYRTQGTWEVMRVYSSKIYLYSFINTVTATKIQQKLIEDDLNAVKTRYRVGTIKTSGTVSWGAWVERTALYKEDIDPIVEAIGEPASGQESTLFRAIENINIDTSTLAQRTDVKDGNDTAIGMLKDQTNGLAAIKTAAVEAKTAAQGVTIPTDYAKAGNGTNVTNTDIKNALTDNSTGLSAISQRVGLPPQGSSKSTLFAYLASIWNSMEGQQQEELPEGLADRVALLLQFFGIAGSFEAEGVGHEQTDNTVINECKTRYAEVFGDLLPSGFIMPNSVTIDGTTYTGTVS